MYPSLHTNRTRIPAVKVPSNLVPLKNWAEPFTGVMSSHVFTVRKKLQIFIKMHPVNMLTPCKNFSNIFLKTRISVISVQILVWVSLRIFF